MVKLYYFCGVSQPNHMPISSTDLSAMNKQTIRFTSFAARVTNVHSYTYTYNAKKTGAQSEQSASDSVATPTADLSRRF